ncbi:hypothetical protein G6011_07382 [Alternaria panax]|uniref:Uncharacterized protein n=1 Tax=Alternaria panax TaxID=48097 RepID=A0AAD4FEP1_9PLEO|nr:hypothetical protein G6011_07382 [Alternaria panax]
MSTSSRLAALEALACQNEEKIEELNHTNWLLNNHSVKTQDEISRFEKDFHKEYPNFDMRHAKSKDSQPDPSPPLRELLVARHVLLARPQSDKRPQPPGPFLTPFYLAAREAPRLDLDFVIPGFQGETLQVAVNNVDLAFILQQTLRRRGWSEEMTTKGVEDFLAQPMMEVAWQGRKSELGNLS